MTFLQLLHKPEHVWVSEEIKRLQTNASDKSSAGPTGHDFGLDHIDTVNDFIAHNMLARHHQVAADIQHYINTNQWIPLNLLPRHIT